MQLLFEEFFRKVNKVGADSVIMRTITRLCFLILTLALLCLFFYSIYSKKYFIIWIIAIVYAIAEGAHYIRKSREKIAADKTTRNNEIKNFIKNILKPEKSKNKNLLGIDKQKNSRLLRKKVS